MQPYSHEEKNILGRKEKQGLGDEIHRLQNPFELLKIVAEFALYGSKDP